MKAKQLQTHIIAAAFICLAGSAQAAVIITPDLSTVGGFAAQAGDILYVTDDSGLSSALADGAAVPATLPTHDGGAGAYGSSMVRWFNGQQPTEFIFDLGSSFAEVDDLILFNYQEGAIVDRGISSVTASYSDDGITYSGAESLSFAATSGSGNPIVGETISIAQTNIQYVKFTNLVNHGGSLIGLAEVRFTGSSVIPEPASLVLVLVAAGGFLVCRRRK